MMRNGPISCYLRTVSLLAVLSLACVCWAMATPANAQTPAGEQQAGWVSDVAGMRHFSGLRCPDVVANLYRTKVLAADADRMSGCVYSAGDGFRAILRQHIPGTGQDSAREFRTGYIQAGFRQVSLTGAAKGGISFVTSSWTPATHCETLWYFSTHSADYTLWMAYSLPNEEEEIGPSLEAFTDLLSRLR